MPSPKPNVRSEHKPVKHGASADPSRLKSPVSFYPLLEGEPLSDPVSEGWVMVYSPTATLLKLPDTMPDAEVVLGRYVRNGEVIVPADYPDITERMDRGPVRFYRASFLKEIDAHKYGRLWEYYAFLKLYASGKRHVVLDEVIAEDRAGKKGYGKLHTEAFGYLTYGPDYEREVERIFYGFLRDVGAYMHRSLNYPLWEREHSPKISVITPVKNRARFVGEAIESVLANDFGDWEMVIVDNGSEDGTVEVVERYSREDRRIKLVRTSGESLAGCLNLALKHSRGWIVAQLDSDDTYTPWALRTLYEYHREHRVGLAVSYYEVVDEDGKVIPDLPVVKHLEYSINNLLRVGGAGALRSYRREVLERLGGFDDKNFPHFAEDYDLVLRLSERYPVGRIHSVLYRYRRHAGSTDATREYHFKARTKTAIRWAAIHRRKIYALIGRGALT